MVDNLPAVDKWSPDATDDPLYQNEGEYISVASDHGVTVAIGQKSMDEWIKFED